jgi:hypothetical protein
LLADRFAPTERQVLVEATAEGPTGERRILVETAASVTAALTRGIDATSRKQTFVHVASHTGPAHTTADQNTISNGIRYWSPAISGLDPQVDVQAALLASQLRSFIQIN